MNKTKKEVERLLWNLESKTASTGTTAEYIVEIVKVSLGKGIVIGFISGLLVALVIIEIVL